jgi:hypothetical protein
MADWRKQMAQAQDAHPGQPQPLAQVRQRVGGQVAFPPALAGLPSVMCSGLWPQFQPYSRRSAARARRSSALLGAHRPRSKCKGALLVIFITLSASHRQAGRRAVQGRRGSRLVIEVRARPRGTARMQLFARVSQQRVRHADRHARRRGRVGHAPRLVQAVEPRELAVRVAAPPPPPPAVSGLRHSADTNADTRVAPLFAQAAAV